MVKKFHLLTLCVATALLSGACVDAAEGTETAATQGAQGDVAVTIGDTKITLDEIDAKAMAVNMKAYQDLYNARRQVIDQMIAEKLFEQEAASRDMTVEELVEAEITGKLVPVTEAQVQVFFQENQNRMGDRTLEQMSGQIRNFLGSDSARKLRDDYLKQLKDKAGVTIALDVPRVEVIIAANDPYKGPAEAKVTIVEYSDFQ